MPGQKLGVKQGTAWLLKHKLMRATAGCEAAKPRLKGRVEVDDAHLGGERPDGKRGRGAAGKDARRRRRRDHRTRRGRSVCEAAAVQGPEREPRRLKLAVVGDGLSCWPAVAKAGDGHRPMRAGSGRQAARWAPSKGVNICLGNIKAAIVGTCRHMAGAA